MKATMFKKGTLPFYFEKCNINYVALNSSKDGFIKAGTPVYIEQAGEKFTLFTVMRVNSGYLVNRSNDVKYFNSAAELYEYLDGVYVIKDQKLARIQIDKCLDKIKYLEQEYDLNPPSEMIDLMKYVPNGIYV